jgi:hypothetical protein
MSAVQTLSAYAKLPDPYRNPPPNLAALQLDAVRERFAEARDRVKVLDKRARDAGITEIRNWQDVVALLFAHTNYKSYPEAFIDNGQWKGMNAWLQTLSTHPTSNIGTEDVRDVDGWLDNARDAGHFIFASSGTSGKSSFLNQSETDREFSFPAYMAAFDLASPSFTPCQDRVVFSQMPPKGVHKLTEIVDRHFQRIARPGEIYRVSDDPILAMETIRPVQLRRLIAAGKASPKDIVAYDEALARRQAQRTEAMERWVEIFIEKRHEPLYMGMFWGASYNLMEALRARGIKAGDFHPELVLSVGGGTKGANIPADYREQIIAYFGLDERRLPNNYGMVELSGLCPFLHDLGAYAVAPWIVPLILDKSGEKLLNPAGGKGIVEGRMAFFDILADARWGGVISGDKVTVEFAPNRAGITGPIVTSIARYADLEEGEDKLSCAGTIDAYVRGAVAA